MANPLTWTEILADIGDQGLSRHRIATPAERKALAEALGLVECTEMAADYRLVAKRGGSYLLEGDVTLAATQACIVTLEPLSTRLKEPIRVEFRPGASEADDAGEGERPILDGPDVEPLADRIIPVGRVVFEIISASLDPYPRKEGANFDWSDPKVAESPANPFGVLKSLKSRE